MTSRKFIRVGNQIVDKTITSQKPKPLPVVMAKPIKPKKSFKELIADCDRVLANHKRAMAESADQPTDNNLYYIKDHAYYLMYRDNKVWLMSMVYPSWTWILKHQTDTKGKFLYANYSDFRKIVKDKPDITQMQLDFKIYAPTAFDVGSLEQQEELKQLTNVDLTLATKI